MREGWPRQGEALVKKTTVWGQLLQVAATTPITLAIAQWMYEEHSEFSFSANRESAEGNQSIAKGKIVCTSHALASVSVPLEPLQMLRPIDNQIHGSGTLLPSTHDWSSAWSCLELCSSHVWRVF